MNVFVLDNDPRTAATLHVDKHVVKMPLESAQMLSTALRSIGIDDARLYRATHRRHPCTLWATTTRENFAWLIDLGVALCDEHRHRYPASRPHKSRTVIEAAREYVDALPIGGLTPHAQAMPDACKVPGDAVAAYRRYYVAEKMRFASYRGRAWPAWMTNEKSLHKLHEVCYNQRGAQPESRPPRNPDRTETNTTRAASRATRRTDMRITTNTATATATSTEDKSDRLPYTQRQAVKLLTVADRLVADDKASKLMSKLTKWAEADESRTTDHNVAIVNLRNAEAAIRHVCAHLDALPEGYAPGAPKKSRNGKFEVGAPVAVRESKLEEYAGLIEDPKCLKVVEVRKTVILIETTDGVRFPIAKAALEVIA